MAIDARHLREGCVMEQTPPQVLASKLAKVLKKERPGYAMTARIIFTEKGRLLLGKGMQDRRRRLSLFESGVP
jgi:hypothetical protein